MTRRRPLTFLEFLRLVGVRPSPAQRVLWSVVADGAQPGELEGEDRKIARELFGDVERIPPELLSVVCLIIGARSGKTYLASLRALHLALTVPLRTAPGEHAFSVVVAPDLRLAGQAIRYVAGVVNSAPALKAREIATKESSVTLRRDDGREVTVEALPATRGGSAVRGRTLCGAILDEAAFFRDESSVVNDAEVYRALAPRVVEGGQVLLSTTPWGEQGLAYELFEANHGHPVTGVAVRAPTRVMRSDSPHILRLVERETERDPETAAREYECEFLARGTGLFFDTNALGQALEDYPIPQPKHAPLGWHFERVAVAVDAGFVKDSSAFAAVGVAEDGIIRVLALEAIIPAKGSPLVPSHVVGRWAELAKPYGVRALHADGHYREAIREYLMRYGLSLRPLPEGNPGKRAQYENAKRLLAEGKVRIPRHKPLLDQLREVTAKPTSGGNLVISSPRRAGTHGDLVSAFVGALHSLAAPPPKKARWVNLKGL